MSEISIDPHWSYRGTAAIAVTTPAWRLTVLPALGGRIWELEYRPKGVQFLWHSPRIPPRSVPFGAGYDDVWSGGWDDIFPTDAPFVYEGEHFPDHGELWSVEWQYEWLAQEDAAVLHLWTFGHVTPTRIDKWLRVSASEPRIDLRYRITHEGGRAFPFLFKLHSALKVNESCRILLPRCQFVPEPEFCSWFTADSPAFSWPHAQTSGGTPVDLRQVCSSASGVMLFGYAVSLQHGWCALSRPRDKVALGISFPLDVLKTCWIFASYGGFRNHEVVVLEPSTGDSYSLDRSVARGTAPILESGKSVHVDVSVTCIETDSESVVERSIRELPTPPIWQFN